ncbi:hypothetical protein [Legionella rowbothamii]|uniref:hypothetical protein n=1 Tax=Legionella rowbothamii TaxID=96229 RepID=UPI001056CA7F|nr:hypothetical protein [Legionella rowbothamii]
MLSLFCKAATNTGVVVASTTIAHITYSVSRDVQNRYFLWQSTLPQNSESTSSRKEQKDVNVLTPN